MDTRQGNFSRLEAEGLIVKDYKFTDEDMKAIESLSEEEIRAIIHVVHKLAPNYPRDTAMLRGIIL